MSSYQRQTGSGDPKQLIWEESPHRSHTRHGVLRGVPGAQPPVGQGARYSGVVFLWGFSTTRRVFFFPPEHTPFLPILQWKYFSLVGGTETKQMFQLQRFTLISLMLEILNYLTHSLHFGRIKSMSILKIIFSSSLSVSCIVSRRGVLFQKIRPVFSSCPCHSISMLSVKREA